MSQSLSVSQYLELVNVSLGQIPTDFVIEGEVSDYKVSQGKWVSFDLKDEKDQALLKCFMTTWQLKTAIEDGMRVQVKGAPKIYERFGTFKLNVTDVEPVGEGALKRTYELLKKKLESEGLFDASRKRPLPRFPERIGLITSRDAAAYGDFLRILNNRWSGVQILFCHVHVQGREAVSEIVSAFDDLNALRERPDVIVLTRGGGGLEDLHAFNDEAIARAIYASTIPVVCAVGHERDESLADFVADVRASTPSNAAERVAPSRDEVRYEIETLQDHLVARMEDAIRERSQVIDEATHRIRFILERQKDRLVRLSEALASTTSLWFSRLKDRLGSHERVLKELNPKRVLARGYSIVRTLGRVLTDVSTLEVGAEIQVQFAAGSADARVSHVSGKGQQRLV
ncbi:exodeoxyribonuclease VII large subunit [Candidatus Uhrbacteria bacterium]|nr:exodeoxyribonuclease VII large subunit [Candidatus Uhrbacteria bacterium]